MWGWGLKPKPVNSVIVGSNDISFHLSIIGVKVVLNLEDVD